jgi:cell division protein FtsQ
MGKGSIKKQIASIRPLFLPVIAAALVIFCASFATNQQDNMKCTGIVINIQDNELYNFINEQDIRKAFGSDINPEGMPLANLNVHSIENKIRKNPFVKSVQVYTDLHGKIYADVNQRIPVIRVINPAFQEYYIDSEGKRMPLSSEYSAYVPMAIPSYYNITGNRDSILNALDSSLFILSQYLDSNKFAHALAGEVIINPLNELTIIPRLGDFRIEIGTVNDIDDKFLRLQSFYRTTLPQVGWEKYKKISLKYKNQIIANN